MTNTKEVQTNVQVPLKRTAAVEDDISKVAKTEETSSIAEAKTVKPSSSTETPVTEEEGEKVVIIESAVEKETLVEATEVTIDVVEAVVDGEIEKVAVTIDVTESEVGTAVNEVSEVIKSEVKKTKSKVEVVIPKPSSAKVEN